MATVRTITRRLSAAPPTVLTVYAMAVSFAVYFCMYAFRKPFTAAKFEGLSFLGSAVELKTALVISQIIGYTLSKYLGIKVCSEATRGRRMFLLIALIVVAEAALLLFAVLPGGWKVIAILLNGLPLGMVWGICVLYLEGRRTSELLLAGLSCSFILASGVVKDAGRALLNAGVSEDWMPVATGGLFLPVFIVCVWLLDQMPNPTQQDIEARTIRLPMGGAQRTGFFKRFLPGMILLMATYFFLTAYRDFRDNYGVEIFRSLGYEKTPAIFTMTELPVAFGVMASLAALNLVKDNRRGMMGAFAIMAGGAAMLGVGTLMLDAGWIDGATWMVLTGLGAYLAYVPFGSVLFDRLIASTRVTGTAVFAIYVADAIGYTGSVAVQLYKDLGAQDTSRFTFFRWFTYAMSLGGFAMLTAAAVYFTSRRQAKDAQLPKPISVPAM